MSETTIDNSTTEGTQDTAAAPEGHFLQVNDLNTFVQYLTSWHEGKVALVGHMKSIPDGTEVSMDNAEPTVLTGDALKGFQLGISYALSELGTLPFVAELEDTPAAAAAH